MAWNSWSSSCDQVVRDSNNSEHPEWQCDFYFGCEHDVIEEDALNEESCIQVLRILIAKEDNELEELEKELLSLQSELACAEHEKWPGMCFNVLSEKINWLDVSIRTLKNDHDDNIETQPRLQSNPSETLHELAKALQKDRCQDACGQELIAKSIVRGPDLRAINCAPDHSDGMKLAGALNLKVTGNEVSKSQLITTDTAQILNSFFSIGEGNTPKEAEQEKAVVKDDSAYGIRLAAGIKGRQKCLGSGLGASQQAKNRNYVFDQKVCDFALKTERRLCKKESTVAPAEELDSRTSPLQVAYLQGLCLADNELCFLKGNKSKNSPHVMNIQNASYINAESSVLTPLEMQTKSIRHTVSQRMDEEKPQAHGLKSEISANLSESNVILPSKQKDGGKRKPELDSFSERAPSDSPVELISKASSVVISKRQQKSRINTSIGGTSLSKSPDRNITKREVQPGPHETQELPTVPHGSKFSELQKKTKVAVQVNRSYALVDSSDKTSASLPHRFKELTLSDLRAIAKQHNMRGYYRLSKGALVELLVHRLSS